MTTTTRFDSTSPCGPRRNTAPLSVTMTEDSRCRVREEARSLYRADRSHDAVAWLERWLANDPEDTESWELLGVMNLLQNDTKSACEALETASATRQLSVGGRLALAECYRRFSLQPTNKSQPRRDSVGCR